MCVLCSNDKPKFFVCLKTSLLVLLTNKWMSFYWATSLRLWIQYKWSDLWLQATEDSSSYPKQKEMYWNNSRRPQNHRRAGKPSWETSRDDVILVEKENRTMGSVYIRYRVVQGIISGWQNSRYFLFICCSTQILDSNSDKGGLQ